jgi:hypothetical protein
MFYNAALGQRRRDPIWLSQLASSPVLEGGAKPYRQLAMPSANGSEVSRTSSTYSSVSYVILISRDVPR